jgi:hypothetical protein
VGKAIGRDPMSVPTKPRAHAEGWLRGDVVSDSFMAIDYHSGQAVKRPHEPSNMQVDMSRMSSCDKIAD